MLPLLLFVYGANLTLGELVVAVCTAVCAVTAAYIESRRVTVESQRVAWDQSDIRERLVKCEARLELWDTRFSTLEKEQ